MQKKFVCLVMLPGLMIVNTIALANSHLAHASSWIDPNHALQVDEQTQLPTFLWAADDNNQSIKQATNISPAQAAYRHLARYADLYQLTPTAQTSAVIRHIHQNHHQGYIVRFGQRIHGIDVLGKGMNFLMDKTFTLKAISGHLIPLSPPAAKFYKRDGLFRWHPAAVIARAFNDLHQEQLPVKQLVIQQRNDYGYCRFSDNLRTNSRYELKQPIRIKKVWYPKAKDLIPAYYLEINTRSITDSAAQADYAYVLSATDGSILSRSNMAHTASATKFTYRVWADGSTYMPQDSAYGDEILSPLLQPLKKPAIPIEAQRITLSSGPISTGDPWLTGTATTTRGNNVDAYADVTRPDGFSRGDLRANVTSLGQFDYVYQFDQPDDINHSTQLKAAIVQAFYTANFVHDWLYDHGFDEAAGNGQSNNYGRGGKSGDPMRVEVSDYEGTDNANMVTPKDGASPTMQLYLWSNETQNTLEIFANGKKSHFSVTTADFGNAQFSLTGKLALVNDGSTLTNKNSPGSVIDACQPLINASEISGAIALINRGGCLFVDKVKHAQDAGAIGVLIANNVSQPMVSIYGDHAGDIHIPVLGIGRSAGRFLYNSMLTHTVTATMKRADKFYNSALDNTIVIHEWGHFLSERLIEKMDNNQALSMGEGWSDFLALIAMAKEQDRNHPGNELFQASYAIGQYVSKVQPRSYSFGIRRYPYSTDLNKNPLTFRYIADGVALPVDIPTSASSSMSGINNSEVHNSGEVWASMLWEVYVSLLNDTTRLSFNEAQSRMLDYLVTSLKMTPNNPTFLEARDALLSVAYERDQADYQLFWQAFAKRGAGANAKAPKRFSNNHAGIVEDFTKP